MILVINRDLTIVESGIDNLFNLDTLSTILGPSIAREEVGFCFPFPSNWNLRDLDTGAADFLQEVLIDIRWHPWSTELRRDVAGGQRFRLDLFQGRNVPHVRRIFRRNGAGIFQFFDDIA